MVAATLFRRTLLPGRNVIDQNFQYKTLPAMKKIYTVCFVLLGFSGVAGAQNVIPVSDELILPQYAYYGGTSAVHRMPFVCRLKITGLTAGTTYRYFTGMSSNGSATAQTPGSMYRINNGQNPTYGYITGYTANKAINSSEIQNDEMQTGFTSAESRHGRFTADGSGTYTGWFACVPVGNATQQAIGSDVYFYVQLNNGSGTTLAQSFRTTSTIKLLNYSSVAGEANGCTALLGTSDVGDEKMVAIYDNTAATGRPLYTTFTENNNNGGALNEGTIWNNPVLYPTVDGKSGSWAAIIPNTLTGGVKAINFLNINDASLVALSNAPIPNTRADGVWNGVATANPSGDSTKPIIINSIVQPPPQPVNLLGFSGQAVKEGVKLIWQTSQEINNKHFELYRAGRDGRFQLLGKVNAVTVPNLTNDYEYVDRLPNTGANFYQLKQVDKDGKFKIYNTILVNFREQNQGMRLVSFNSGEIVVGIMASDKASGKITFTDVQGSVLYNQAASLHQGENIIRIPVATTSTQMGVVSFTSVNGERMSLKIVR
jgi:hypothetical protein